MRCVGAMYGQGKKNVADLYACRFYVTDAQRNYRESEHETLAISEALLKREDKLLWYPPMWLQIIRPWSSLRCKHRVLQGRQMSWMDYLAQSDFDIGYVKGSLNKILDGSP